MTRYLSPAAALVLLCALCPPAAKALRPGDIVTSFGNQGYVRIPFDRAGESPFDSAHFAAVRYENVGLPVRFPFIYAAGIAGDRAAIVKLDSNGQLVAGFGANGRAISTQYGLGSIAGLGFAPNGDVVIAYSTAAVSDVFAHANGEDFFVEVFDGNGQPRVQQQTWSLGNFIDVNWVGVNTIDYSGNYYCDPDDYILLTTARSMALAGNGDIAVAGSAHHVRTGPGFPSELNETVTARFRFDAGAGVYRVADGGNLFPHGNPDSSCMGNGAYGYTVQSDHDTLSGVQWSTAAAYLTPTDLRVAGPISNPDTDAPGSYRRYAGYDALPTDGSVYADTSGSAQVPAASAYWGADARNTEIQSMQWVPERPNLFLYGTAEDGFFAGGTQLKPIIAFDEGTQALKPRWAFLNADMSALYSASTRKGLYRYGKHVLLGALRLCAPINDCTGEWDSYFVSRTGGEPDAFAFPPDAGFGESGSRAYRVPGNPSQVPAERAFAWDGAVLASNLVVPGQESWSDLIVVGDFRRAGSSDPSDYDWFITRIRLRGEAGNLDVTIEGAGRVTAAPAGIDCPGTCSQPFDADSDVVLTATADVGSGFSGWSGCEAPIGTQCRVHIDGSLAVTARFTPGSGDIIFADSFEVSP